MDESNRTAHGTPHQAGASPSGAEPGEEGSPDPNRAPEEPVTSGTLFLMVVFLMALAGLWGIMFLHLLNR